MRGMNQVMIVGNVGADPELRVSQQGNHWCVLAVATHRNRRDGDGWIEETDWHDVKVFGEDAARCVERLSKGSVVAVEGTLAYESWTTDDGQRRRAPRIYASRVRFVNASASSARDMLDAMSGVPAHA